MDIHVEHPGGVECVTVASDATVAELRDAVAESLSLTPACTVLAHEGGGPLGADDVPLCDVLCSDTVQVCPPSAAGVACGMGLTCKDLAPALCKELRAGRSGGERAQVLLSVLEPSHWRGATQTLMRAVERCPTPAVLRQLLASCGDCISEGRYAMLRKRPRPWELRLCLRAGLLLEDGLLWGYGEQRGGSVPRDLLEIMLEEAPERCFDAGLLHGAVACGDDAMLERCLALGASPAGALRTAVKAGRAVSCAPRLVAAGCVADADAVLVASQLGHVGWLRWLFDEMDCGVDVADADGRTALHVAGSAEVVRFLAARGARPDLRRRGGLSVAHRVAGCNGVDCCSYCGHDPETAAQQDEAFAEVLATWPRLVHAEDWEGGTPLRWIWRGLLLQWRDYPSCISTTRTIERSNLLVTSGANVREMTGLQTIDGVEATVQVTRDETGLVVVHFDDWNGDAREDSCEDAADYEEEEYEWLCCRVKRSGRSKRRRTRTHKYRAWVP